MANNETLGASFSIDVTDLKAGLTQANRLIRESESEFKAAAAGMDNWADSEDGLNAKIKSLNSITEIQRKKVDALQEEYERLIADGLDPASKEAVELRTKINNETAALNKNEAELKKQTKALEELSDATEDAGDAADDASDGFTVMKGAAATLVAEGITRLVDGCKQAISTFLALGEETREYRENLIKLNTSFQTASLSAEDAEKTFTDLYAIMGDEGAATEAAQQLAKISKGEKDLEANTRILTGVMAEYGESIPLTGLAEGIAASSAMSSVQGVLADALEWQGVNLDDYNEKLEKLSTEEKRSAYIQETLIDLYGESADLYRENNAAVISARKETAKYNKVMAELGEEVEPVNAEITELKTEFAREFAPVLKKQVAPAIKEFVKKLKETGAAEKVGKAIGFLAENFETLATTTFAAVTVFKAFSAAMAISGAITAARTAVAGLSAGVSVATKTQTAWNVAMSANPIGAVLTAVGLLAAGIAVLAITHKDATIQVDALSESQRQAVNAAKEAADAYRDTKQAADEMAAAGVVQLDNTELLWRELQNLADANGKVKDSDKARAEFILGELNNALDKEYSMTGNVINNYKNIKKSIEDVITTKRAQILLEAYEKSYAEAIKSVAVEEKARAILTQELITREESVKNARIKAEEARAAYEKAIAEGVTGRKLELLKSQAQGYETAVSIQESYLKESQEEYLKSDAIVKGYYDIIDSYVTASTLVIAGETEKAIGYLDDYGSGFQTAATVAQKSTDEQLAILREQVVNTEIQLGILEAEYENAQENMTEEERKQAKLRIDNARKQATDAKNEYYKVGGDMVEGMVKGAEDGEWTLTGSLKTLVTKGVDAAKKALGIQSPSRVYRDLFRYVPEGGALGIKDGTPSVVKAIKNQVNEMRDAYDLSGVAGAVNTGVAVNRNNAAASETQSGGVTVYQTNNYKQAYESPIEKYKSKQELFAAARMIKAGAY